MALVIKDRVKELTTTAGTGAVTLLGSPTGYQTFTSAVGNGNTTYYAIVDNTSGDWEVGLGTYTSATTSLSRDTVLSSSNAGSLVTFSSSSKDVFVTYPASKGIYTDSAGNTIALGTPASATLTNATGLPLTTGVTGTLPIANGGTGTTSTTFTNLTTNVTGTLPVANGGTGITSLGTGVATFLGTPTSANLASAVTDETGSGSLVFATSPTLVTPVLGTPSSGTLTSCTGYTYANLSGTVPTWNQNTTGSAATLTTPRAIYGNNFDGSAALTQVIASTYGGTGNGFTKFTGATTAEKTYTLPDATTTILTTNATVTVGQGGTGTSTAFTTGSVVFAGASGTYTQDNANFFWDDTNNRLGIGTATPSNPLNVVANTSVDAVRITQTGAGNALVVEDSANPDSTPFVIDAAGQVIQGNATNVAVANPISGAALSPSFEIVGTSALTTPTFVRQETSVSPQCMIFAKSRGSVSSPTVLAAADVIGRISFQGYDGANFIRAAAIDVAVDGTPGTTDMPGRLIFSTTADGASSPTEAMRITSAGDVGIGTTSPTAKLSISGGSLPTSGSGYSLGISSALGATRLTTDASNKTNFIGSYYDDTSLEISQGITSGYISGIVISARSATNATVTDAIALYTRSAERMRIHSSGGVSIGNTTDSGLASLNVSGSISGGYIAHANGTTAMAFGADNVARVTPNATATFTSTVPAAGAICVLSILTSGTSSYTITFGTGFKSTGTLATGTVSARYFNITFVSDGTNLIEMSRTTAIT